MLIGEFISPLGERNRIALPKKFKDELGEQIMLTRGYENCLIVVDQNRWHALLADINKSPLLSMSTRDTKRFLLGGAYELTLDSQGRFVVPEALVNFAEIKTKVCFIGVGEWLEIWDFDKWQLKLQELSTHAADIADRL